MDGQDIFLTASLGITSSMTEYEEADHVVRDATTAMHRAKANGRSAFVIFDHAMHEQAMTRLKLEADLRQAVARQEFRLHYQPIIALDTGRLAGFEALIRWQHPEQGLMMPHAFLATAQELGMLPTLGEWSCEEACRQLRTWHDACPRRRPLTMSVNFSIEQFRRPDLAIKLRTLIHSIGLSQGTLKIEITESEVMEDPKAVSDIIQQLNAQHIETCLDDFGTGYSSLSHLQRLPITFLKIDQSFVRRLGEDDDALAIIKTIVVLAHQLGRKVIAEGVETSEQLAMLRSLACEYAQGYLFAKPLPEAEVRQLLITDPRW
jgi:EAL domain-containing protein (putative c-di-GMP-specific phosphodiesterase class I)